MVPKKVKGFKNNVAKVSMGINHTCVVTGKLIMWLRI